MLGKTGLPVSCSKFGIRFSIEKQHKRRSIIFSNTVSFVVKIKLKNPELFVWRVHVVTREATEMFWSVNFLMEI